MTFQVIVFSLLLASALPLNSYAKDNADELCKVKPTSIITPQTFSSDGKTHLQSDKVELGEKETSRFSGNVVIQQKDKRIETQQAEYIKQTEQVNAQGNVSFITPAIKITSDTAQFNLESNQAILNQSEFQSLTSRARGSASKIEVLEANVTELSDATYTTCDPGNSDWYLSASSIELNGNNSQGHAKNVVLRFKDVPFFYFPYLRFPLGEDRLSGFLFPYFGHSDQHGSELKVPYYWNIHPQLDATIAPHYMSRRGTLLGTEVRYLTQGSNGILQSEYLAKDKEFGDKRERVKWTHQSTPGLGWQANAEYNYVGDTQHLVDFSNDLNSTSTTYLTRTANVTYSGTNWLMGINAEAHQIISGANQYKRLPQVTLSSRYPVKQNQLNYAIESEAVRFDHAENQVIGQRLHVKPMVSLPYSTPAGFIEPKISVQHTQYNLEQTTGDLSPTRTVPTFSLNSGLFFERETKIFNTDFIQTLEPQIFYVYTPYKDQSNLPVFDTSAYAFNINQFFADYRFNGHDRVGDDNRLTTAITTRFINQQNGQEVFMARAGQISYFADRQVQLSSAATQTSSRSNIIAELKTQLNAAGHWSLSSQIEWDPDQKENASSSNQLGYRYNKFQLDLAHRFQRDTLETREIKMNWEINSRWNMDASHLYDLKNEHVVENLFGVKYESCCWGLRLSTKERYLSASQTDRGIYLELILKGLGGFGIRQ
jgi:LPS-assembly protein